MIRDEKQPRGDRNSFSRLDFDRLNGKMRGAVAEWSVLVCPYKITKGYFLNTGCCFGCDEIDELEMMANEERFSTDNCVQFLC